MARRASARGCARYFAVETHRGHISLDLAKQSGHLNFKYRFYDLTSSDDPRQTARDVARELVSRKNLPFSTLPPPAPFSLESGNFHRGNAVFFAEFPLDTLLPFTFLSARSFFGIFRFILRLMISDVVWDISKGVKQGVDRFTESSGGECGELGS